jgi:hypothetical protein
MNRIQLEHIIRAASQISGDSEIVVIGSQAIHAQMMLLRSPFSRSKLMSIRAITPNSPM